MKNKRMIMAGDVVTLNSGGPRMTVTRIVNQHGTENPIAYVSWFDDPNVPAGMREASLTAASLKPVTDLDEDK